MDSEVLINPDKGNRVAVFASGGGSNFEALTEAREEGKLDVEFSLLVSNNSGCGAAEKAEKRGVPFVHISDSHFKTIEEYEEKLISCLTDYRIDVIVLAGYMKKIPGCVVRSFKNRMLNIHPALLPSFGGKGMYGKRVHRSVIDSGVKITGVSVHLVDEEYDRGPIVLQRHVYVADTDTPESIAEKVLELEHNNYWKALKALAEGSLHIQGRRVTGGITDG